MLEGHGNKVSESHRKALEILLTTVSEIAFKRREGRVAFGLPTGMGKTTAIVAWTAELVAGGHSHIGVGIAAGKVESLCEIRRALIKEGVPADRIGLVHSYRFDAAIASNYVKDGVPLPSGYASEPSSTGDSDRFQVLLITHERARGGLVELNRLNRYHGGHRSLVFWDESLLVSDSLGLPLSNLRGAIGFLSGTYKGSAAHAALLAYLEECLEGIESKVAEGNACVSPTPKRVLLPQRTGAEIAAFQQLIERVSPAEPVRQLLNISSAPIRIFDRSGGAVLWWELAVPSELKNIVILDASWPIRDLIRADKTIQDGELLPLATRNSIRFAEIKRFDKVAINMVTGYNGGRESMSKEFNKKGDDQTIIRDIAAAIQWVPHDAPILFVLFKDRASEKTDFKGVLFRGLQDQGIDPHQQLPDGRPRINVLTWGNHTGLNSYAHCEHVVIVGILHRSPPDLAASCLGQRQDWNAPIETEELTRLKNSELCHVIYQALSRGSCRLVDDGMAHPMTAWIIGGNAEIRKGLEPVMPGAKWEVFDAPHSKTRAC